MTIKRISQISFGKLFSITFISLFGLLLFPSCGKQKKYARTSINDLVLIYQGGTNRLDWTEEQFAPYVLHTFADGHKDWFFDGFLFLEFANGQGVSYATGYAPKSAVKTDWEWLLDRIFEKGKSLSALDRCIDSIKNQIGTPGFKHKIVLGLPMPRGGQEDWGELNGKKLSFSLRQDQLEAEYWYIDQLLKRFNSAKYNNLELYGFYWVEEDNIASKGITVPISSYIHSKNKLFCWIPYWKARGFEKWKELGFDIAYQQPNYYFDKKISIERLKQACDTASKYNMGMEMEFDKRSLHDTTDSYYSRFKDYINSFDETGVFASSSIAYYCGGDGILKMYESNNTKDREIMDDLARHVTERRNRLKTTK
ncbi:MAG: DUF4855 domain-containing protein [Bacteroidales bacterium]|jgi:hypothetical protein|nr:DUF4855 domain-containing protein [Bacteroidales bacterium]